MSLYTLGDPHLSFGVPDKKMDKFSKAWKGHEEKIRRNWLAMVRESDTVVLAGDFSWGRDLEECGPDFDFIGKLPGRKILIRGNHDMFWDAKKTPALNALFEGQFFFLQDNFAAYEDYALVGTKGICFENLTSFEQFRKLQKRETERLRTSFEAARAAGYRKFIVFLHYPPTSSIWPATHELCGALGMSRREEASIRRQEQEVLRQHGGRDIGHNPVIDLHALPPALLHQVMDVTEVLSSPFTRMAEEYGAEQVIYAHSHGKSRFHDSIHGELRGVRYQLVSGDYLDFKPFRVIG